MVCTIESIEKRQKVKIDETVELFGLSEDEAIIILRYFKWNFDKI